jgi:hypothetical protein
MIFFTVFQSVHHRSEIVLFLGQLSLDYEQVHPLPS